MNVVMRLSATRAYMFNHAKMVSSFYLNVTVEGIDIRILYCPSLCITMLAEVKAIKTTAISIPYQSLSGGDSKAVIRVVMCTAKNVQGC